MQPEETMTPPLEGIRVLDFSIMLAAASQNAYDNKTFLEPARCSTLPALKRGTGSIDS